jgi:hypothetical protein
MTQRLVIPHSSCPEGFVRNYNISYSTSYYEREEWRHTPASCGTAACAEAISSFIDAVVNKTGFRV